MKDTTVSLMPPSGGFFMGEKQVPEKNLGINVVGGINLVEWWQTIMQAVAFTGIGVLIALGQILQTKDPITLKVAIGRCITTGGIALAAGAALTFFPGIPFIAQIGIAATLASLGNSGLEMLIHRLLNR